jgi:beta-lactam-binding protein with PASTA domain
MRKLFRYFALSLILLLVCLASALLAMRFAIHGREVRVPKFQGMTSAEAERLANTYGLVLSVDSRFYSTDMQEGRIVSQMPAADSKVRRGLKVRVAESLGPPRSTVPNLVGQSQHAANLNVSRRGLEISAAPTLRFPGAQPDTVVAQSPPADVKNMSSPKIGLLFAAPDNTQWYIMPRFVGRPLAEATQELSRAGFTLGTVNDVPISGSDTVGPVPNGTVLRQYPPAGQRIAAGSSIAFDVAR